MDRINQKVNDASGTWIDWQYLLGTYPGHGQYLLGTYLGREFQVRALGLSACYFSLDGSYRSWVVAWGCEDLGFRAEYWGSRVGEIEIMVLELQ